MSVAQSPGIYILVKVLRNFWQHIHSVCVFSCVQLFATPWTVTHQAPLPMEFSRQDDIFTEKLAKCAAREQTRPK